MAWGPEWVPDPDGVLRRSAARVIVLDADDRLLLVRGHDADAPERTWWFTVGGGIDPGESPAQAAIREVFEETGLRLDPAALIGPVLTRSAIFDFFRQAVRQDEVFFLARVPSPGPLSTTGWTAIERDFMDEAQWWALDELADVEVEVFPAQLVEITRGLLPGWDGVVLDLGLGENPRPHNSLTAGPSV